MGRRSALGQEPHKAKWVTKLPFVEGVASAPAPGPRPAGWVLLREQVAGICAGVKLYQRIIRPNNYKCMCKS